MRSRESQADVSLCLVPKGEDEMSVTLIVQDSDLDIRASVRFDRWDGPRAQYVWTIESLTSPEITATGDDLRLGPFDRNCQDAEALATLLGFFGAYCDAVQYERRSGRESDNSDLFPETLRDLADVTDSDALAMLALGIYSEER